MSYHGVPSSSLAYDQASTSANPFSTTPANYHPHPRPVSAPPVHRVDIHAIKQELHDALGEHGLPYWKAVNGYLLGQVGRGELQDMVRGWLKGNKVHLHNRLLISLLHNASAAPPTAAQALSRKRKRVGVDDPEFDIDDTYIEPRARVHHWVVGMSSRERARVRRVVMGRGPVPEVDGAGEDEDSPEWDARKRRWSLFQPNAAMPPLALSSRHLPSSHQLSHRLGQLAKAYDLTLAPDAFAEIGDFMAVGMDAHLGDILHGIVHMTGRERPGEDTIRVPKGTKLEPDVDPLEMDIDVHGSEGHGGFVDSIKREPDSTYAYTYTEMPKPDIETFQNLFLMMPGLHPQASPALYKLETSLTRAEADLNNPVKMERKPSPSLPPSPRIGDTTMAMTVPTSPKKTMAIGRTTANRAEVVAKELLESGLLKLDKAGRQSEPGEAEGKKDKKHNLHWKYEDPALILRDILG